MQIQMAVAASKVDAEIMRIGVNGGMTERAINMGKFYTENKNRSFSLTVEGKKLVGYADLMIARDDMPSVYGIEAPYTAEALTKMLKWAKARTAGVPEFAISQGEQRHRLKPI
jgi:hypothetical protein